MTEGKHDSGKPAIRKPLKRARTEFVTDVFTADADAELRCLNDQYKCCLL